MSKLQLMLACLLTVLSTSALTSSSAFGTHNFIIEGKAITEKEAIEGTGVFGQDPPGRARIARIRDDKMEYTAPGGIRVKQECAESMFRETFNANGVSKWKFEGSGCAMWRYTGGVPNEVPLPQCRPQEKSEGEDLLGVYWGDELMPPAGSKIFGTIEVEGAECVISGKFEIEGTESCAISEAQMEKVVHEYICTSAGSGLKISKEPAQLFQSGIVRLNSNKTWSTN